MASFVADAITFNTTAGDKTVAITPAVGDLLVVVAANTGTTTDPTVTDDRGGTYTRINGCAKATSADEMHVYVRNSLCQLALAHTITQNVGGAGTGGGAWVARILGMEKSGGNAARQSAIQSNQAAATTPAPVFAFPVFTGNLVVGAIFNATNVATLTPPTSHTERQDVGFATPTTGLETTTRDSGETATTITWGSTSGSAFCSLVLELDCATATAVRGKGFPPGRKMPRDRPSMQHPAYPTAQTVTLDVLIAGLGTLAVNFVRDKRVLQSSVSGLGALATNFVRDKRVLATSIAGTGSVVIGFLARTRAIAVVISGVGTVAADLVRIKLLASSIAGTGTVVANFVRDKRVLNVVVAGTGSVSAALARTRVLAASVSGTGTLAAANSVTRSVATVIAGQGSLVAVYVRNQRVLGTTIGGIGTVVADLTVTLGAGVVAKLRTLMGVGQ